MKKLLCAITCFAIFITALAVGCSPAPQESAPPQEQEPPAGSGPSVGGTFIEGASGGDAETLNWLLAADGTSHSYINLTIDTLATYNNDLDLALRCLARDIEVSADGLVYTVTIRDDLTWSDGSQVTADDYVYTLENLMFSDWLNYPYRADWQEVVNGETVYVDPEAVDSTTFTITRKTVDPEFNYIIYDMVPYPRSITEQYEGDIEAFTQAPEFNNLTYTGNLGPYTFKEWIRNDRFVCVRNPDYYLGKEVGAPYFEEYVIKLFGTNATMLAALEAGDITYCGIEPEQVARFKQMDDVNVFTIPSGGYTLLAYNQRDNGFEGLKERSVRQGLSMAIGKEQMSRSVYLGFAEPAYSFIPVVSPWYDDSSVTKYGVSSLYDKQKAAELFYQAGYGEQTSAGTFRATQKNGQPLTLTLVTTTGGGTAEDVAYFIKQELKDIGIEVELKLVPWETMVRQYMMNSVPGSRDEPQHNAGPAAVSDQAWDLALLAFSTDVLAPSGSSVFFTSDGGINFFGYTNTEVDRLFDQVKTRDALDEGVRRQIYGTISKVLSVEQPVDFLTFRKGNIGIQSNVKGIEPGIAMGYNQYLWYFE